MISEGDAVFIPAGISHGFSKIWTLSLTSVFELTPIKYCQLVISIRSFNEAADYDLIVQRTTFQSWMNTSQGIKSKLYEWLNVYLTDEAALSPD